MQLTMEDDHTLTLGNPGNVLCCLAFLCINLKHFCTIFCLLGTFLIYFDRATKCILIALDCSVVPFGRAQGKSYKNVISGLTDVEESQH